MLVQDYSTAFFDLLLKRDTESLLISLKLLLKKKGHEKLYRPILNDLLLKFKKSTDEGATQVIVSREKDIKNLEENILKTISTLDFRKEFITKVDPTLIGGYKIVGQSQICDQSYKKQLLTVYRALIT